MHKFGILNLRTWDTFSLRRVAIPAADVEQSPLLLRAEESLQVSEASRLKEAVEL